MAHYPRASPFPGEDDFERWLEEARAVCRDGGKGGKFEPAVATYPDLIRRGAFIANYKAFCRDHQRQPETYQLYRLGFFFRSVQKHYLENDKMLRIFCKEYLSIELAEFKYTIDAMKLLGNNPGLLLSPSAAKFFNKLPTALSKIGKLVETSAGEFLRSQEVYDLVFPSSRRASSRTSPAFLGSDAFAPRDFDAAGSAGAAASPRAHRTKRRKVDLSPIKE